MPPEKYARHIGVNIGENCFISTRNFGTEPYLITIGDNVQITRGVHIFTHGGGNSVRKHIKDFDCFGKVVIEDWAYVGAESLILPGVTIGEGALVAAGSVVTKSVPRYTVVGGNPARCLCSIQEYINKNEKFNLHTAGMSQKKKRMYLTSLPNEKFISK